MDMVTPIENGCADAVFGSRMIEKGAAREGAMPLYKYCGNRILSSFQNWITGERLSEYHSGFRAYRVEALKRLPLQYNTNDFHFDTQIIYQLLHYQFRIREVPIPVFYGDEICYVNGLAYAFNVFKASVQFKLHNLGIGFDWKYQDGHNAARSSFGRDKERGYSQTVPLA